MKQFYKTYKCFFSILILLIFWIWISNVIWWTHEQIKMIKYRDNLSEQGIPSNYLNSIADIVIDSESNKNIDVINKLEKDIIINPENTYFTQKDYKKEGIHLNNFISGHGVTFIADNWNEKNSKNSLSIWLDYYASNEIAPKNPTSVLPIHKPCKKIIKSDFSVFYSDCETYVTTDNQPLFVSYFENWNDYQWWGFTIVEVRKKLDDSLVNKFFIWESKFWDMSLNYVVNKSYTYWVIQKQDRSNLYISKAWGNLNLNWIKTLSYDSLSHWEYVIYFQNINKFGLKSDRIKAWYLKVIPPKWSLQNFNFIDIVNLDDWISKNINWWNVSINFKKWVKVRINNPWNYNYDILSIIPNITKNWNEFIIDELQEGINVFNFQIKDEAWNILNNKQLIITADTISPIIWSISLDYNYLNKTTTDWAIAMINHLWIDHVNDNIQFSWVSGWNKVPFTIRISDNVSLSWLTVQYSLALSWLYNNVLDFIWNTWDYKFNVDTSFVSNDWEITLFFRAIDKFGNISVPTSKVFYLNRNAKSPIIFTNNWSNIITNNDLINIKLELEDDVVKVLYDWFILENYEAFSTIYSSTIPLKLGEKNYIFSVIDLLWNRSYDSIINILKNPTPKEWVVWEDQTIKFEGGVKTNKLNLQRVTSDWTPWEIFSN